MKYIRTNTVIAFLLIQSLLSMSGAAAGATEIIRTRQPTTLAPAVRLDHADIHNALRSLSGDHPETDEMHRVSPNTKTAPRPAESPFSAVIPGLFKRFVHLLGMPIRLHRLNLLIIPALPILALIGAALWPNFADAADYTVSDDNGRPTYQVTVNSSTDTLSGIAKTVYGNAAAYADIAAFNHMADPDLIKPGQQFNLPDLDSLHKNIFQHKGDSVPEPEIPVDAPLPDVPQTETDQANASYHIVVRGDTLNGLAEEYRTSTAELQRLNKTITNPDHIDIGQKILLPSEPSVGTVQPADLPAGTVTEEKLAGLLGSYTLVPTQQTLLPAESGIWQWSTPVTSRLAEENAAPIHLPAGTLLGQTTSPELLSRADELRQKLHIAQNNYDRLVLAKKNGVYVSRHEFQRFQFPLDEISAEYRAVQMELSAQKIYAETALLLYPQNIYVTSGTEVNKNTHIADFSPLDRITLPVSIPASLNGQILNVRGTIAGIPVVSTVQASPLQPVGETSDDIPSAFPRYNHSVDLTFILKSPLEPDAFSKMQPTRLTFHTHHRSAPAVNPPENWHVAVGIVERHLQESVLQPRPGKLDRISTPGTVLSAANPVAAYTDRTELNRVHRAYAGNARGLRTYLKETETLLPVPQQTALRTALAGNASRADYYAELSGQSPKTSYAGRVTQSSVFSSAPTVAVIERSQANVGVWIQDDPARPIDITPGASVIVNTTVFSDYGRISGIGSRDDTYSPPRIKIFIQVNDPDFVLPKGLPVTTWFPPAERTAGIPAPISTNQEGSAENRQPPPSNKAEEWLASQPDPKTALRILAQSLDPGDRTTAARLAAHIPAALSQSNAGEHLRINYRNTENVQGLLAIIDTFLQDNRSPDIAAAAYYYLIDLLNTGDEAPLLSFVHTPTVPGLTTERIQQILGTIITEQGLDSRAAATVLRSAHVWPTTYDLETAAEKFESTNPALSGALRDEIYRRIATQLLQAKHQSWIIGTYLPDISAAIESNQDLDIQYLEHSPDSFHWQKVRKTINPHIVQATEKSVREKIRAVATMSGAHPPVPPLHLSGEALLKQGEQLVHKQYITLGLTERMNYLNTLLEQKNYELAVSLLEQPLPDKQDIIIKLIKTRTGQVELLRLYSRTNDPYLLTLIENPALWIEGIERFISTLNPAETAIFRDALHLMYVRTGNSELANIALNHLYTDFELTAHQQRWGPQLIEKEIQRRAGTYLLQVIKKLKKQSPSDLSTFYPSAQLSILFGDINLAIKNSNGSLIDLLKSLQYNPAIQSTAGKMLGILQNRANDITENRRPNLLISAVNAGVYALYVLMSAALLFGANLLFNDRFWKWRQRRQDRKLMKAYQSADASDFSYIWYALTRYWQKKVPRLRTGDQFQPIVWSTPGPDYELDKIFRQWERQETSRGYLDLSAQLITRTTSRIRAIVQRLNPEDRKTLEQMSNQCLSGAFRCVQASERESRNAAERRQLLFHATVLLELSAIVLLSHQLLNALIGRQQLTYNINAISQRWYGYTWGKAELDNIIAKSKQHLKQLSQHVLGITNEPFPDDSIKISQTLDNWPAKQSWDERRALSRIFPFLSLGLGGIGIATLLISMTSLFPIVAPLKMFFVIAMLALSLAIHHYYVHRIIRSNPFFKNSMAQLLRINAAVEHSLRDRDRSMAGNAKLPAHALQLRELLADGHRKELMNALRQERNRASISAIIIIADPGLHPYIRQWAAARTRENLIRNDTEIILVPSPSRGSGAAFVAAERYLREHHPDLTGRRAYFFAGAAHLDFPHTKHPYGNKSDAFIPLPEHWFGNGAVTLDKYLLNAYALGQQAQAHRKTGRLLLFPDGNWDGPLTIGLNADISLLGIRTTFENIADQKLGMLETAENSSDQVIALHEPSDAADVNQRKQELLKRTAPLRGKTGVSGDAIGFSGITFICDTPATEKLLNTLLPVIPETSRLDFTEDLLIPLIRKSTNGGKLNKYFDSRRRKHSRNPEAMAAVETLNLLQNYLQQADIGPLQISVTAPSDLLGNFTHFVDATTYTQWLRRQSDDGRSAPPPALISLSRISEPEPADDRQSDALHRFSGHLPPPGIIAAQSLQYSL